MSASWYDIAAGAIREVQAQAIADGVTDPNEIKRRVDAAYPFGQRRYHPYAQWLKARKELLRLPGSTSAADQAKLQAWVDGSPITQEGKE
jgi:hypothetical protein